MTSARFLLIVVGIILMVGLAYNASALTIKYEWDGKVIEKKFEDVSRSKEFIEGNTYSFIWKENATWYLNSTDGNTRLVWVGNEFKVKFDHYGKYNLTILDSTGKYYYEIEVLPGPLGGYLALVGAGLAVGLSAIGSGIGVGIAGSAAAAAVAENPRRGLGRILLFQAIPQTQAIYGLVVGILILLGIGGFTLSFSLNIPLSVGLCALGAGLAVGFSGLSAIGQGIVAGTGIGVTSNEKLSFGRAIIFTVLPETQAIYGLLVSILIMYGVGIFGGKPQWIQLGVGLAAVGAGLGIGLSGLTAIGQGIAASGSASSVSENPRLFTKGMIFSALPETQSIYALVVAIIILSSVGLLSGKATSLDPTLSIIAGIAAIGAGLATGFAGLSGIGQGIASSSGISSLSKEGTSMGKMMLFAALPETQAIYGLLVAIFIMFGLGFFGGTIKSIPVGLALFCVAAGLAIGISGLTAIGQGIAAASGAVATSENPKMFSRAIVFSILPETQSIYALVVSIIMLFFGGIMGAGILIGDTKAIFIGIGSLGAGLAVGLAGLSGIGQGITASMGVAAASRRGETFAKSILFAVMSETFAIFGLVIAMLILKAIGLF